MQKMKEKYLSGIIKLWMFIVANIITFSTFAQTPTHIPRERTAPVDFFESTESIIFFIVIPVIIVILYLLWRRERRKQKKEADKEPGKE
jgi:heme/copper-type cytochrome/quinol oxidase subunit 2